MRKKLVIALGLAMILAMAASMLGAAAELITAELDGSTPINITVAQGGSVSAPISVWATGTIDCAANGDYSATATVDTVYALDSAGALTHSTPSAAMKFYSAEAGTLGTLCAVTWDGAPTPYTVNATFSVDAATPLGDYTIDLYFAAGTTNETNLVGDAIKNFSGVLGDAAPTKIIVHVVAPTCTPSYTVTFRQPFDGSSPSNLVTNTMKSGRVVPVKVTVFDNCAQAYITDPSALLSIQVSASGTASSSNDAVEVYADAGASSGNTLYFRWTSDSTVPGGGFWIYNLDSRTALGGSALAVNHVYRVDVWLGQVGGGTRLTGSTWALLQPVK